MIQKVQYFVFYAQLYFYFSILKLGLGASQRVNHEKFGDFFKNILKQKRSRKMIIDKKALYPDILRSKSNRLIVIIFI